MNERPRWVQIHVDGTKTPLFGLRRKIESIKELTFETATQKYKEAWEANALTPELVNQTWRLFWRHREQAARLDHQLAIPRCDRTTEELVSLREKNRGVILLPNEVVENTELLLQLFPEVGSRRNLHNLSDIGGCLDVEMVTESPNMGRTLQRVKQNLKNNNQEGQRVASYVVASVFHHLITGEFFDVASISTLPGSRIGDMIASGVFNTRRGNKINIWTGHSLENGYRTEGRKQV